MSPGLWKGLGKMTGVFSEEDLGKARLRVSVSSAESGGSVGTALQEPGASATRLRVTTGQDAAPGPSAQPQTHSDPPGKGSGTLYKAAWCILSGCRSAPAPPVCSPCLLSAGSSPASPDTQMTARRQTGHTSPCLDALAAGRAPGNPFVLSWRSPSLETSLRVGGSFIFHVAFPPSQRKLKNSQSHPPKPAPSPRYHFTSVPLGLGKR